MLVQTELKLLVATFARFVFGDRREAQMPRFGGGVCGPIYLHPSASRTIEQGKIGHTLNFGFGALRHNT